MDDSEFLVHSYQKKTGQGGGIFLFECCPSKLIPYPGLVAKSGGVGDWRRRRAASR